MVEEIYCGAARKACSKNSVLHYDRHNDVMVLRRCGAEKKLFQIAVQIVGVVVRDAQQIVFAM